MEQIRKASPIDFIGPVKDKESLTDSAATDIIEAYLRKFHLSDVDALIPQSIFYLPMSWEGKTFWGSDYSTEYSDEVINDIFLEEPNKFFDFIRQAIINLRSEKGDDLSEWNYLRIKLIEDKPISMSEVKPYMVNSPTCFDAVIIGIEPRILYIKKAWFECPKGHSGKDIECDKYRKLSAPICTHPISNGSMCNEKMFLVPDKSMQDFVQSPP